MRLDQVGVQLKDDGSIAVSNKLETFVPGIYAIGDAAGGSMLSPRRFIHGDYGSGKCHGCIQGVAFHLIPRGIWTIPQVGSVGLSEEEAEKKGITSRSAISPMP